LDAGHSCISDSLGDLIIYTHGGSIFNKYQNIIENGDSLIPNQVYNSYGGDMPLQQSTIILPMPDSQYYMFCTTYSDSQWYNLSNNIYDANQNVVEEYVPADLLLAHKIDMRSSVNNGLGKVTRRMDTLFYDNKLVYCQMTAVKHGNGRDWWLIKQGHDTNLIYKFLVTPDSIFGPYLQGFSEPHFGLWHLRGQSVFNQTGDRYATLSLFAQKLFVADFDRCTGMFTNPLTYNIPCGPILPPGGSSLGEECESAACTFSPNGRFVYTNHYYSIQQLDLLNPDTLTQWTVVGNIDSVFAGYLGMQIAPNNKIYIGNYSGGQATMSVIQYPDSLGTASGFCPRCLQFPPQIYQGVAYYYQVRTPPNMPNYSLGNLAACDTIAAAPLLISLLDLSARNVGVHTNRIDWQTATEAVGDAFVVERSPDGRSFESLPGAMVAAKGNGGNRYTYYDEEALTGVSYYRLQLINAGSGRKYSKTVSARTPVYGQQGLIGISAWPNPVRDKLVHISLHLPDGMLPSSGQISVFDMVGRVVMTAVSQEAETNIDLTRLSAGIYNLKFAAGNESKTVRLTVE
jgi:hypothetical protein